MGFERINQLIKKKPHQSWAQLFVAEARKHLPVLKVPFPTSHSDALNISRVPFGNGRLYRSGENGGIGDPVRWLLYGSRPH